MSWMVGMQNFAATMCLAHLHWSTTETLKVEVRAGTMGSKGRVHNTSAFATRKRETAFNR